VYSTLIRNEDGSVNGWYIFALGPDGIGDVLQIAGRPHAMSLVLDHLFHQAWEQGALAVTGRFDSRALQPLSDKHCFFHWRGPWLLVKSSRPEVLRAFHSGDASFSRFDGEWCLGF
jgi:hypothetical protein